MYPLILSSKILYLTVNNTALSQQMNINKGALAALNYKHTAQNGFPLLEPIKPALTFVADLKHKQHSSSASTVARCVFRDVMTWVYGVYCMKPSFKVIAKCLLLYIHTWMGIAGPAAILRKRTTSLSSPVRTLECLNEPCQYITVQHP